MSEKAEALNEGQGQGKDLAFIYLNDIRGEGFMVQHVLGVIGIEPPDSRGLQVVHTVSGDKKIGTGYIRIAEHI